MKKKLLSALLSVAMVATLLVGCGGSTTEEAPAATEEEAPADEAPADEAPAEETASAEGGKVYYLNFKPEQGPAWEALAKAYTEETGVEVQVVTAASGQYETTLMSEMGKSDAPTLFQVNGPVGLANWKDYCYDLAGSDVYAELTNESFALKEDDTVYGIGYVIESYGIIANKTLLAEAGYDVAEIDSFEDLKACAEDITARSEELGFSAFSSAGMESSSDWRFKTHLANLPIYFEYEEDGISSTAAIKGTYLDNYRAMWDLYINNSTCEPDALSAKTGNDSKADFVDKKAAFYQNGSWEYNGLIEAGLTDEDLVMIPIYFGVGDEANQGLCTGCENFWCVNAEADEADIQATLDFLAWCVTSEKGTTALANEMGFVVPFKKAVESPNLFVKQDTAYTAEGKNPVAWTFTTMPSEEWKNGVGSALTAYAADQTDANWDAVVAAFVDGWATEYSLAN